jgi:hypothetical protein
MTSITWRNFRSNDMAAPLSVEEIFRRYGSWSGIHDFSFDVLGSATGVTVTGNATGYTVDMQGYSLPANFTLRYHKTSNRQAVFISGGSISLFVGTDSSGYIDIRKSSDIIAQQIPRATPTEADVEIVFRQQTFDDISGIVWRSATVYMNDSWVATYSDYVTQAYGNLDVGFTAYGSDITTYTNISVPELGDTAEFGTTDPGEYPMGGLQRTIEGRYLHYFVRWDGTLRAWKKKQRQNILTLNALEGVRRSTDLPQLITHARMMGAYIWAEQIDANSLKIYGHRFQEVNNSMLLTQPECFEEAGNELKRSQENTFNITAQSRHIPILEPEDRITIDGEDWIVNDYTYTAMPSELSEVYNCRKYVWG